ncbi:GNAT family N-acetyltransferase [Paenibacillus sp. SEL1]|uniref:GNAT family N-acetyltransferase n=1 Tax=Paenibacillus polymyxa TaxID=1406 RepID=A0AAE9ID48_PAEPO|nr:MULTISPECIES: GNAT family N-acetyltransferase [Paenibacillus]AOK92078.1 GCN5 family acetyltransferase [Paenibacillus polymyxa]MCP3805714.1 GNAT family N-acetyltransferase [Paenibacillus sp. Lou8.1]MDY8045346.1 GNAT family N-acetyltransferase [Paenibacillus polymyxa]URJ52679.1 GNAT family N-acetyltransferase [Paenibacillus polymyxa]
MPQISDVQQLPARSWLLRRRQLLFLARSSGGMRITRNALRQLAVLTPEQLNTPGSSLLCAYVRTEKGLRIAGFSLALNYGKDACIVIVRPLYRGRRLGARLLSAQLKQLRRLTCSVAADNMASLKTCFRAGLVAHEMTTGPTGKPTLIFHGELSQDKQTAEEGGMLCQNLS